MSKAGVIFFVLLALGAGSAGGYLSGSLNQKEGGGKTVVVKQDASRPASSGSGWDAATQVYKKSAPGVVYIRAGNASGSGFVISKQGDLLSNAHVVGTSKTVQITFAEGGQAMGKVVSTDRSLDVALIKVSGQSNLKPLPLGDLENLQVGQPVMAIGNPFGLEETLTVGVISALNRSIRGLNGFTIPEAIQTDAAINPGNSGGPLLDAEGRVLGINTQIVTGDSGGGSVGIGFAVPIDAVSKQLASLRKGQGGQHGWLGVQGGTLTQAQAKKIGVPGGTLVGAVTKGSPAAKSRIKAGDVILSVDGKQMNETEDLTALLGDKEPGDQITLVIRSGKTNRTVRVVLGNRPNQVQP